MLPIVNLAKSLLQVTAEVVTVLSKKIVEVTPAVSANIVALKAEVLDAVVKSNIATDALMAKQSVERLGFAMENLKHEAKRALGVPSRAKKNGRPTLVDEPEDRT